MSTPGLSRLPKWAQNRIEVLERNLESARAKLAAGPEDSDTFADIHTAAVRPLGRGTLVRFGGQGYDCTFDVEWQDGVLHVQGNASSSAQDMVIKPQMTNAVQLTFVRETDR